MNGIVSHAQNFEDVILWQALHQVEKGFYIDIGAQHPIIDSVSLAFYERGWRGIHIEPCPAYAELLRVQRPDETVIQAAVGTKKGLLTFFEIPETGLSTADVKIAERHRQAGYEVKETHVPCLPLSEVFEQAQGREIHWLKIDVEGWEKEVLASWGRSRARPWIVVVESTLPNTQEACFQAWEDLLVRRGYRFAYFDGLNRFYVHQSHEELLPKFHAPPNLFDDFQLAQETPHCAMLRQEISSLKDQTDRLNRQVAKLQQAIATGEAALATERQRSSWLEGEWEQAKTRIEELAASLAVAQDNNRRQGEELQTVLQSWAETQANNQTLTEELQATRQALTQIQANLAEEQHKNRELEAELTTTRTKGRGIKPPRAHHWYSVAQEREKQLNAMYASWSWKVTAPLRLGYDASLALLKLIRKTLALSGRALLWPLLCAMRWVLRDPALAAQINQKILKFPWLHARLRQIAVNRGLIQDKTL